jgi:hypothetical protein
MHAHTRDGDRPAADRRTWRSLPGMLQTRPIRYPWPGRGLVAAALRFRMFCPAVRDLPPAGLSIRVSSAAGRACYAPASLSLVLRRGREQAADDLVEAGLDAPPVMAVVVEEGEHCSVQPVEEESHQHVGVCGRGRTGDLGPCRPGPTPAEPPRGSATVTIAQGKGNPEGNRRRTGTGQRPKGPNRRTPDEGKPEDGGRRGRTRRANGKPEESPQGRPEDVR